MIGAAARNRWVLWGPYVLLALGLLLRWWLLVDARFTGDEALFYRTTQQIAQDGTWPVLGPPVSGTEARHPGAGFYYLMSIPAALSDSPVLPGAFVALLSALSLGLLVTMARRTRGDAAAWVVGALGATSPWLILYADRIWNSNVAPWMALTVLYGVWRMHVVPRSRWIAVVAFGLMALFQFHLSAPVLWVAVLACLAVWRPRWNWKALAVGIGLGVLWYTPYLVYELSHDFANSRAILHRGTGGAEDAAQIGPALTYLWLMGTGEIGYHVHTGYWQPYDPVAQVFSAAGWADSRSWYGEVWLAGVALSLLVGALGIGRALVDLVRHAIRRTAPADPMAIALVTGGVAGVALLVASNKPVYPHYVNLLLAPCFFLAADGVAVLTSVARSRPLRHALSGAIVLALMVSYAVVTHGYYRRVDARVGAATSLAAAETIVDSVGTDRFSLHFRTFPNHFALGVLARTTLHAPWNEDRNARRRFTLIPIEEGVDVPTVRGDDRLYQAGDVWIVERR